jgi:DNA-binding transcriptional LysR family regulator
MEWEEDTAMDTLQNVRTFLLAAHLGSFAAAARSLSAAPSVVSKRIGQLEHEFRVPLFHRSTRELRLTVEANRLLPRFQKLLADFDEIRDDDQKQELRGHLRIDAPGTVTSRILGPLFCEFLAMHPGIDMDLRLNDRLQGSVEQGCDLIIGTRPSTYEGIHDHPLMPYTCATYASAAYVAAHGEPEHPRDLADHDCLVSLLYGTLWHFYGEDGDFAVSVTPRMSVNDTVVLREAVCQNLGIAVLPTILAEAEVTSGRLRPVLPGFRPPPMWLKALVPSQSAAKPAVQALLQFLRERLAPNTQPVGTFPSIAAA